MKRPAFVITTPTGSPLCGKCRSPLPPNLPASCPGCGRELDYSTFMIKSKLTEIKRKKVEMK
jgi:predicted amidophosphoribosyltransferase